MSPMRSWGRTTWIFALFTLSLLVIVAVGTIRMAFYSDDQKEQKEQAQAGQIEQQEDKKDFAAEIDRICKLKTPEAANLRKRGKCEEAKEVIKEPTVVPEKGDQGDKGEKGDPPSDEQVQRAVDAWCSNGRCNGKSPTPQQVAAAVAAYCNARGQCTPPKPKDGAKGEPGENATSEQIAAAVASFCAGDNCDGDDGKDGKDGENGTNGTNGRSVSVSTTSIEGGTRVTVSYSDDTPPISFDVMNGAKGEPGKVGPPGPAGPACPTGYHLELRHIVSTEAPTGEESQVCMKDVESP
jgi:hypothetical protein